MFIFVTMSLVVFILSSMELIDWLIDWNGLHVWVYCGLRLLYALARRLIQTPEIGRCAMHTADYRSDTAFRRDLYLPFIRSFNQNKFI